MEMVMSNHFPSKKYMESAHETNVLHAETTSLESTDIIWFGSKWKGVFVGFDPLISAKERWGLDV